MTDRARCQPGASRPGVHMTTGRADTCPTGADLLLPVEPARAFAVYAIRRPPRCPVHRTLDSEIAFETTEA